MLEENSRFSILKYPTSLTQYLDQFEKIRLLVVGDVGVDRYTEGSVDRISPEAPVPIVLVTQERLKLGLAANVADNIHALRGQAELIGIVGQDRHRQDFEALLEDSGISTKALIIDPSRRTVLKERIVSDRQQLLRVDYESQHSLSETVRAQILTRIEKLIDSCDGVILEDYCKGMLNAELTQRIFELGRKHSKRVFVDPNSKSPVMLYQGAFLLTPNTREAEKLSGTEIRTQEDLLRAGEQLLTATSAEHIVITRGKDGMAIFSKDSPQVRLIPTFAREVYDVSGAGDTVISVLAMAMASGATVEEAAFLGNLAAGVEVAKRGTATVSQEEILEAFAALQRFSR